MLEQKKNIMIKNKRKRKDCIIIFDALLTRRERKKNDKNHRKRDRKLMEDKIMLNLPAIFSR